MNTWAIDVSLSMLWPPPAGIPATIIRCFGQLVPEGAKKPLTNLQPVVSASVGQWVLLFGGGVRNALIPSQVFKIVSVTLSVSDELRCLQAVPRNPLRCWFAGALVWVISGNSARGVERVKTLPKVGAFSTLGLLSIFILRNFRRMPIPPSAVSCPLPSEIGVTSPFSRVPFAIQREGGYAHVPQAPQHHRRFGHHHSSARSWRSFLRARRAEGPRLVWWLWIFRHHGFLHPRHAHPSAFRLSGHLRRISWRHRLDCRPTRPCRGSRHRLQHDSGRSHGPLALRLFRKLVRQPKGRRH